MKEIKIDKFTYEILNDKEVSVVSYNSIGHVDTINIHEKVTIYSIEYIVVHISNQVFKKLKSESTIFIPRTVRKIEDVDIEFAILKIYFGGGWHNWSEIEFNKIRGKIITYLNNNGTYYQLNKIVIGSNGKIKNNYGYSCFANLDMIPNGVTIIGKKGLKVFVWEKSILIPNTVKNIESDSFTIFLNKLENLYYNGTIEEWCNIKFFGSPFKSLKEIYMLDNNNNWYEVTEIEIPSTISAIQNYQFCRFNSIKSITIPDSVTSIGYSAFSECSSLTSITIPNSVTSIRRRTFEGCTNLKSVTIPNSVTSIEYGAFEGCSSLTSITIPNSVTSIESSAFKGCTNLKSVTIPNSVTRIEYNTFEGCSSLTSITIPNSVTRIEYNAFGGCSSLTSIIIPNGVTNIGFSAFKGCTNLTIFCESTRNPFGLGYYNDVPTYTKDEWEYVDCVPTPKK